MSGELMLTISRLSSLGLLLLVLALTAGLLASKFVRATWARYVVRREEVYKPAILQAIADAPGSPLDAIFGGRLRLGDRAILEDSLLRWAQGVRGYGLERLCAIFERAGFAADEERRLGSLRWWVRAMAARRLGLMRCFPAVPSLLRALDDSSLDVRLQAAWSLGRLGQVQAVERIVASSVGDSRLAALRATNIIMELGSAAVPALIRLLESADPRVQALAVDLLGALGEKSAAASIAALLPGGGPELRVASCRALGRIAAGAESAERVAALLGDAEWPVRAKAAQVLGQMRFAPAVPGLQRAMRDRSWSVRVNAGEALARLGEPGRAALEQCLSDEDRFARDMAVQWIDELAVGAAG